MMMESILTTTAQPSTAVLYMCRQPEPEMASALLQKDCTSESCDMLEKVSRYLQV